MTSCLLVAGILQCIVSTKPPLTPAEAAKILEPRQFVYVPPTRPDNPGVFINGTPRPQDGPYGPLLPAGREPVRLDGTPLSQPPWELRSYYGLTPVYVPQAPTPVRRR